LDTTKLQRDGMIVPNLDQPGSQAIFDNLRGLSVVGIRPKTAYVEGKLAGAKIGVGSELEDSVASTIRTRAGLPDDGYEFITTTG
jgi:hypothetical protein